ncbi:carboxymuconolactone decarboxylase family protein [Saccharothrix australiensis]|uniref:4-carboxymuconolactone decarboxylase n=1 Tax=Saccharothrix australiensis TaxID=2072 RepID=A0A495VYE9_9PSEU|nr:carboxymuconolactone decarboxylase family protein [Saccharothrix australiensis]RKT54432.1 4-carboxymuconolactone decarboxylase [Saccharothrix australiensis]
MARVTYPHLAPSFAMPTPIYGDPHDGTLLNVFRILGHNPALLTAVADIGRAQALDSTLTDADRELVVLAAARHFGAEYVWAQHRAGGLSAGLSPGQLAALSAGAPDGHFDDRQRAVLAFVAEVAAGPRVDDAVFARLREHFRDSQVVEVVALVGVYFMVGRLTTVLDIEIDAPADPTPTFES